MDDPPVTTAPAPDARTRILDAAEAIVQARGVPALTLEAAARDAGVSKGGLLYHFASKEALLAGMLGRLAEAISHDFDATVAAQAEGPGRVARALLAWAFEEMACEHQDRAAAVFLAAFHHDRALLDPVRVVFARMRAALAADGLPPGAGQAIMCATDGLFMSRVFGMYELDAAELRTLRAALERLLESAP
ncbi:TetR/AcrR family transcriptional regulator [Roseomonas stagni]|uniref:TetR/AcrR family transcriptional regulator n=1 Tax=Falsiroseomonas algicola TaxID=2716930 RepID=A0A6M1LVQ2_9PROT|nr:TetR/AcrR family transcriptional regulator [Falsiroseomonas algicola]NGM24109.1 TetR/AcrR family transcriptional regulator [Falsiroseomonas algicola]